MAVSLNQTGYRNALSCVRNGKVNRNTPWSFSAEDGNKILGDPPNWSEYKKWFLGRDTAANPETKEAWKYPFGKSGEVYRSALIAIRQRAGQQEEQDIFEAAGRLLNLIDAKRQSAKAMVLKSHDRSVPTDVLLLPFGEVHTTEGSYLVDEEAAALILSIYREIGNDIVIDYEHQTLKNVEAPAAGWVKKLYIGDDGIYGKVDWTERAKEYIAAKEYRYLSPVVWINKEGRAVFLQMASLTNLPATKNAKPLINKQGRENMEKVLELLGIEKEDQIVEAIKALKQRAEANAGKIPHDVLEALGLKEDATISEIKASILALRQSQNVQTNLVKEVEKLKDKLLAKEIEELVEMALKQGKITPAQQEWAREYARKDIKGFKIYVQKAPRVVPVGEGIVKAVKQIEGIDDVTVMIAKQMEVNIEDIKKYALKEG